jgi:hypothetical protein
VTHYSSPASNILCRPDRFGQSPLMVVGSNILHSLSSLLARCAQSIWPRCARSIVSADRVVRGRSSRPNRRFANELSIRSRTRYVAATFVFRSAACLTPQQHLSFDRLLYHETFACAFFDLHTGDIMTPLVTSWPHWCHHDQTRDTTCSSVLSGQ